AEPFLCLPNVAATLLQGECDEFLLEHIMEGSVQVALAGSKGAGNGHAQSDDRLLFNVGRLEDQVAGQDFRPPAGHDRRAEQELELPDVAGPGMLPQLAQAARV